MAQWESQQRGCCRSLFVHAEINMSSMRRQAHQRHDGALSAPAREPPVRAGCREQRMLTERNFSLVPYWVAKSLSKLVPLLTNDNCGSKSL